MPTRILNWLRFLPYAEIPILRLMIIYRQYYHDIV
eukprot:COSAG01_NODE_71861_length_254_cov_1.329032_1_plen_34_part_10